jgi:hypothetical protein
VITAARRNPLFVAAAAVLLAVGILLIAQLSGDPAGAAGGPKATKSAKTKIATKTYTLSQVDDRTRFEVLCPKGKFPYGGGYSTSPAPADGEGIYPNSYERLGVQHGYHITANLVDLLGGQTTPRNMTLQVVCGPKPGKLTPPHQTTQVAPGEQKELTIKCPGRRQLIGGGHQRTERTSKTGNFVTESRATASDTWHLAGTNTGGGQRAGEMTGIAYCVGSKKPLLKEVSATTQIARSTHGSATTPRCPKGRTLVFGGFSTPADGSILYLGGSINGDGTWTVNGFNETAATGALTGYGYCLNINSLVKNK